MIPFRHWTEGLVRNNKNVENMITERHQLSLDQLQSH